MTKFMQSVSDGTYRKLEAIAKERDITIQELIRAVVIPEWLLEKEKKGKSERPVKL